jgi:hypothetical protein
MYARSVKSSRPVKDGFDKYDVLQRPVATEKAMKKMEEENTMVLLLFRCSCAPSAPKRPRSEKLLKDFITPRFEVSIPWSLLKARRNATSV